MKSFFKIFTLLIISIFFLVGCANQYYDSNKAHHTPNGFKNLHIEDNKKGGFFKFIKMKFFGDDIWANHEELKDQIKVKDVDIKLINSATIKPRITWLGHSTFLVQHNKINILTDPIFSDRASPFCFVGPKRYVKHPIDYNDLPKIDLVIISHNHYDHLDKNTIKRLVKNEDTKFYVPLGLKSIFIEYGTKAENIIEMDWNDEKILEIEDQSLKIKALPSQHWSARSLFDRFETLWASWFIEFSDFNFFFAGDTGYNDIQFKEIGEKLKSVDFALIPIGAYAPRWFMKLYHVNPLEAVYIHQDIKAKKSIGMHWGTFSLTAEEPIEPTIKLEEALKQEDIPKDEFRTLDIGESISLEID